MGIRRTAAVTVPLFPVEREAAHEAAEAAGVSVTEFCRSWLREGTRLRKLPPHMGTRTQEPAELRRKN